VSGCALAVETVVRSFVPLKSEIKSRIKNPGVTSHVFISVLVLVSLSMRVRPQVRQEAGSLPLSLGVFLFFCCLWSACSVTIKNRPGQLKGRN
jgi:hypothetical protein